MVIHNRLKYYYNQICHKSKKSQSHSLSFLKEKFTLANNSIGDGITDVLARYESQSTHLISFEQVRDKN